MEIKITESAITRIKELITKNQKPFCALRVAVNSGGCSGFSYEYELTNDINPDDYVLQINGIKIVIDPMSQSFLDQCTIDFVQELGNSYFQINNPNASAKCGCGNSFAV
ncbi:MAG: iron-sulfur cluster insertion protein ErpA [Rickettsiaceae bacterium]|nr:iron-sulfur cluster insertion protein ErpA [Rickettsiaceae bacterium]